MAEVYGILTSLNLCVGCYACEVACKQENNLPTGTKWIEVATTGPEEANGKLRMDFSPLMRDECTLCEHRLKENLLPRCVDNCPTEAMLFCRNAAEVLAALQSGRRFQVSKLKKGEARASIEKQEKLMYIDTKQEPWSAKRRGT